MTPRGVVSLGEMPSTPTSKSVRWAEAAEARDAETGEVEEVALDDGPSKIRLKCLQDLKEARAQQGRSGVTYCERALQAAEAAEGEDRLEDAEQILELIIGHLHDAMATAEFQMLLVNLRAHQAQERWAREDTRARQLRHDARATPWDNRGGQGEGENGSGAGEARDGAQGLGQLLPPPALTRQRSTEDLEATEEESRGLAAAEAAASYATDDVPAVTPKLRDGHGGDGVDEDDGEGDGDEGALLGGPIEDQLPDEYVLMAHACFLAARVYERQGKIALATQHRDVGLRYAQVQPGMHPVGMLVFGGSGTEGLGELLAADAALAAAAARLPACVSGTVRRVGVGQRVGEAEGEGVVENVDGGHDGKVSEGNGAVRVEGEAFTVVTREVDQKEEKEEEKESRKGAEKKAKERKKSGKKSSFKKRRQEDDSDSSGDGSDSDSGRKRFKENKQSKGSKKTKKSKSTKSKSTKIKHRKLKR